MVLFQEYTKSLVRTIYRDVTWSVNTTAEENVPPSHAHRKLRPIILKYACEMEEYDCLNKAKALLKEYLLQHGELHPDIRELAYYYG